jgi:hypothetical protein
LGWRAGALAVLRAFTAANIKRVKPDIARPRRKSTRWMKRLTGHASTWLATVSARRTCGCRDARGINREYRCRALSGTGGIQACHIHCTLGLQVGSWQITFTAGQPPLIIKPAYLRCGTDSWGYRHINARHSRDWAAIGGIIGADWRSFADQGMTPEEFVAELSTSLADIGTVRVERRGLGLDCVDRGRDGLG